MFWKKKKKNQPLLCRKFDTVMLIYGVNGSRFCRIPKSRFYNNLKDINWNIIISNSFLLLNFT